MRILLVFLLSIFTGQVIWAQEDISDEMVSDSTRVAILGDLNVNRDPRLDKMLRWHIEKNQKREGMEGYRVEIFFSSKMDAKEQALNTKAEFLKEFPDYVVHVKFVAPNFRVRVGDFRTKNEAWKLFKEIQEDYPAAFVVPDVINFPLLKPNQYE